MCEMCAVYHIENTGVPGKKNELEAQTPKMASFLPVKSSDPAGIPNFKTTNFLFEGIVTKFLSDPVFHETRQLCPESWRLKVCSYQALTYIKKLAWNSVGTCWPSKQILSKPPFQHSGGGDRRTGSSRPSLVKKQSWRIAWVTWDTASKKAYGGKGVKSRRGKRGKRRCESRSLFGLTETTEGSHLNSRYLTT